MIIDEIIDLWDQRPFVPFEMTTADGAVHRVLHEKLILMTRDRSVIHYVNEQDRSRHVAVQHVTSVAPVARRRVPPRKAKAAGKK